MATKKDETNQTPTQGEQAAQSAEQAGQRVMRNAAEAGARGQEAGRQTVERMAQQTAEWQRQSSDQATRMADRTLRQASEMAQRQGEEAGNFLALSTQAYQDLSENSRADLDAMVQSGACLARGLQELGWEVTNYTQTSVRLSLQLATDLMECRSVEDMVARQRDFVKESVDALLAESARLLQLSSRMTNDAVTPISDRVGNGSFEQLLPEFKGRRSETGPRRREAGGREASPQ